ncbi:hypothetical protein [Capillimicrobium parvum]|uniref:Uncharacterized protein n=1 Tax=Capillimicrobium parvum TaxID=2884022 RepID=A0A9E6Y0M6_9ACTN|nr:hypothetical protein [Capillimicrobium parvum]UGS37593.1 hypothetical protein DSM104329_04010 [Capillimicrobium parvum]
MLPAGFDDLAPLLDWALPRDEDRIEKRLTSSIDEATAFYDAMLPRFAAVMKYLGGVAAETPDADDRRLQLLATAFVEIADTVEFYAPTGTTGPEDLRRFTPAYNSVLGIALGGHAKT